MKKFCCDCEYCEISFGAYDKEAMKCNYFSKDILAKYDDVHEAASKEIACEQYYSRQFPDGYNALFN